jgi:hypothetical protein
MRSNNSFTTFWTAGAFYGLCWTGIGLLRGNGGEAAIVTGLVAGAFFGFAMAAILMPLHRWWLERRGFDPEGADPGVDVRGDVALSLPPEQALARCRAALEQMRTRGVRVDSASATVRAHGRMTWASFGERIECRVHPADEGSRVEIRSRPSLGATVLDYGKNRENVEQIRALLAAHASAGPVAQG